MNKTPASHAFIFIVLAAGLFLPGAAPMALAEETPSAVSGGSLEGLLNPDGTLRLQDGYSGSLNVAGWNVRLDSDRGPIFTEGRGPEAAIPTNSWAAIGSGDGGPLNGEVWALATYGSNVYVAGNFLDAGNNDAADYLAMWDGVNWSSVGDDGSGGPAVLGIVWALAVDSSNGNLYAGGTFSLANDPGAGRRVAMYDGTWHSLGNAGSPSAPSIDNGAVFALGVDSSSNLYVGGSFVNVQDSLYGTIGDADHIARWDGSHWYAMGSGPGAGLGALNNNVLAIATYGSIVYAGGRFEDVFYISENGAADYVAKWESNAWYNLGSDGAGTPNGSLGDYVTSLAVDGSGNLYVGGNFSDVNNGGTILTAADYVAKWTPGTPGSWSALGSDGASGGSIDDTVSAVLVDSSNIYIGGSFNDVSDGGTTLDAADYIARWNGTHWFAVGADSGGENSLKGTLVRALASGGAGSIYAGGYFDEVHNGADVLATSHIARWTGSAWMALGSPQGSINGIVYAAAVSGTNVYVGGNFTNVADNGTIIPEADYIARWDGAHWNALGSNGHGDGSISSGPVQAIVVSGGKVFVGGGFQNVANGLTILENADFIAMWDGTNWSGLGTGSGTNGALNASVFALAADVSGNIYAGGQFFNVDNGGTIVPEADYVAKWNGTTWSALGGDTVSTDGSLKNQVQALAVSGSNVYAGGYFQNVVNGGTTIPEADYIAKWDGSNWSALGNGGAGVGSLGSSVWAIAVDGTDVYAGGYFQNVLNAGGLVDAADFIAKWDGVEWSALGHDGGTNGSLESGVMDIAILGPNVYASGFFVDVDNAGTLLTDADFVAMWDGTDWSALGDDGAGGGSISGPYIPGVHAIAIQGSDLFAGGKFWNVNNGGSVLPNADYVAAYGLPVVVALSSGGQDGWILESTETSGVGGTKNAGATTFSVGDEKADKQYRSILSFNTSAIPEGATLASVTLKFKQTGLKGTNPFTDLGDILVDLKKGAFGTKATLQLGDFKAKASKTAAMTITDAPVDGWYTGTLAPSDLALVSTTGTTQFRLRFTKEDNDDKLADYLKFASGNASLANRPVLIITYTGP